MRERLVRQWKKVFESDLSYISLELKDIIKSPSMIILEGPLGAGKTTFAKQFINDGETLSPTYSIISESETVLHADFYRIKSKEEVFHLELPLYLEDKQYFLVEWGKLHLRTIAKELPQDFSVYLLGIQVNENAQQESDIKTSFSRNLSLYELFDI